MLRIVLVGLLSVVVIGLLTNRASAQIIGPRAGGIPAGPTVSPYLNLLRTGNSPALNYYGLVRPQFQTNADLLGLQQRVNLSQGRPLLGSEPADDMLVTGHAAVFMNYGAYFQSATGAIPSSRSITQPAIRPAATSSPAPRLPRGGQ